MLQFVDLCRLCAQKKRKKFDLFAKDDEESRTLLGKICLCLSISITRDDMLPKMVCNDCQKSIEQFNSFKIKCQKAEERLNKMLSCNLPNKPLVKTIKEECLETEFNENSQMPTNAIQQFDEYSIPSNLQPVHNVKLEVYESDDQNFDIQNEAERDQDLAQIISEEIANHNDHVDIKQPIIEVISEDFFHNFKSKSITHTNKFYSDKVTGLNYLQQSTHDEEIFVDLHAQSLSSNPIEVIKIKMQEPDSKSDEEKPNKKEEYNLKIEDFPKKKIKTFKRRKRRDIVETDEEIDKKYLVLGENEECNIDMEEIEAIIRRKNDPNTRFNCNKCNKSFKFFKQMKKHRATHENEPECFICDTCWNNNERNFEFSSLKSLKNHVHRFHSIGTTAKIKCNSCKKTASSQGQLNAHFKKVHDYSGASCPICYKAFKNKVCLKDHLKVHRQDKPYVCDQCGQSFKWNHGLKVHIQSHNQEKNFLCSDCGKKFSAKKNLLEHLNIHTGKRPHVCKFCNASFTQLSAYSKHVDRHNDSLKIHKCDKCEKCFTHNYMLKKHKIQHTNLRPFSCRFCCSSFKSTSDLCKHEKIHKEKKYSCNVCGKKFSRSETLKDHMVRHTGIKHICPVPGCGKAYTQRFPLTRHFSKNHPLLKIINRPGGKKAHFVDKVETEEETNSVQDFIRYNYTSIKE